MSGRAAFQEMIEFCDALSKAAERNYKGERKKGVLAGIKMVRDRAASRAKELEGEEVDDDAEGAADVSGDPPGTA